MTFTLSGISSILEVVAINIALSGDNLLLMVLLTRTLPADQRRRALAWGSVVSVACQFAFTMAVARLLLVPGLRPAGAMLLGWVAFRLPRESPAAAPAEAPTRLAVAIGQVAFANLAMGLDNAVATAEASAGDPVRLGLGLVVSACVLFLFGTAIADLMGRSRRLALLGACLVAATAAGMFWRGVFPVPRLMAPVPGPWPLPSDVLRWTFTAVVVAVCLTSPLWWPRDRSRAGAPIPD